MLTADHSGRNGRLRCASEVGERSVFARRAIASTTDLYTADSQWDTLNSKKRTDAHEAGDTEEASSGPNAVGRPRHEVLLCCAEEEDERRRRRIDVVLGQVHLERSFRLSGSRTECIPLLTSGR